MNQSLQFDFLVNREDHTITVKREFAANRRLVWDCHTKSELLDQWFAPKPLTAKTKSMNFSEGGHWLFVMTDPEGAEYWSRQDYLTISPIDNYTALDAFSDKNGSINPEFPRSKLSATFKDLEEHTLVETVVAYSSLEALEMVIRMGLKEGLTSTLERLDELLSKLNK